jgi:peptide-methionine (S)-S-oxide reductase
MKRAVFAGGCFWCTEAVFKRLKGVHNVKSGFTGGFIKNPAYREVCQGRTGHAEGIRLDYDESLISYTDLLEVFFATHDPTTLNRQANDVGTHYRSAIFYSDQQQFETAKQYMKVLDASTIFEDPIVTELTALEAFYDAEEDHDNYYDLNPEQPYCTYLIDPKIKKLTTHFKAILK